ncbi:RNA polymerase factor sigma-70 [Paraburkholderia phenoliruptrix]|uniref:RNA polymerase factor sigma-70 n=1 Tax=Paraburkholderia phenoliruptrix TaxID=252970 RepID=A0ABV3W8V8_9BURK|nr:RNA polymerase factor sigma-70 [Paraburkholderia phenoliruptrix]MDR6391797.1 RNA polymerase sigma-70 factor (ECF subfamily) [Paraburkholderia phenoliruptrix]
MFNTDSLALQPTAEWRTCSNPVRDHRPAHERQPFKRKHLSSAKRGAEHLVARVSESGFDDPVYLTQLRRDLVRFARLQLRDAAAAEDAVQEALAAAWTQADRFAGQSEHKTWVFGILRHKLVDTLRARQRTVNLSALESELEDEALLDRELFKDNGHWSQQTKPRPWPTPETALRQQQFWILFEMCLEHLPEHIGRVFMMREFLDLDIEAICSELRMTANHCSVLIYRARLRLRTCLSEKGLSSEDANGEV